MEHRIKNTVNCTIIWEYVTFAGKKIVISLPPFEETTIDSVFARRIVSDCPMIQDQTKLENDPSYLDRQMQKLKIQTPKKIEVKLENNCAHQDRKRFGFKLWLKSFFNV